MLILSRSLGESVRIGDDVVVRVLAMDGDMVSIGVEAPEDMPVHLEESYQGITRKRTSVITPRLNLDALRLALSNLD